MTIEPIHPLRKAIVYAVSGQQMDGDCSHEIIHVTLKHNAEQYALDISSAQYGYYEPVVPWREYMAERVRSISPPDEFQYFGGSRDRLVKRLQDGTGSVPWDYLISSNINIYPVVCIRNSYCEQITANIPFTNS